MTAHDPRIDVYIQKAQPFARPILTELRARIHAAVPGLEETIKWNSPFFLLDGRLFASMAGFKAHAKLNLWNADFKGAAPESYDARSLDELPPPSALAKLLKTAAAAFGGTQRPAKPAARKAAPKKTAKKKATAKK